MNEETNQWVEQMLAARMLKIGLAVEAFTKPARFQHSRGELFLVQPAVTDAVAEVDQETQRKPD